MLRFWANWRGFLGVTEIYISVPSAPRLSIKPNRPEILAEIPVGMSEVTETRPKGFSDTPQISLCVIKKAFALVPAKSRMRTPSRPQCIIGTQIYDPNIARLADDPQVMRRRGVRRGHLLPHVSRDWHHCVPRQQRNFGECSGNGGRMRALEPPSSPIGRATKSLSMRSRGLQPKGSKCGIKCQCQPST